MSAQHTPGPWVYGQYNLPDGTRAKITTVAHCCDYVIGLPSNYPGGNYRDGDPSGNPEADARLIAAAPDLMNAAEAALHSLIADGHEHYREAGVLRAAIAKAKGAAA